ncbi:MAG: hypothetical protein KBT34_10735 [Prevotella sp.]|nr:hypothetical protein [Candidatus Prevotella equi]
MATLEQEIIKLCQKHNFWFHDLDHKDELLLGKPYNSIYVSFDKYTGRDIRVSINNGTYEGSCAHKSIVTPVRTHDDIKYAFKLFSIDNIIDNFQV